MPTIARFRATLPLLVAAAAAWLSAGCVDHYYPGDQVVYTDKVIKVRVDEVKDKGSRYDVESRISNTSDKSILILFNSFECFKGQVQGDARYVLGIGERFINIPVGSTKRVDFQCKLPRDVEGGTYRFKIGTVFDNPSKDGRTEGAILERDITVDAGGPAS